MRHDHRAFDYEAPESPEEAVRMLHENGEDAKLLAGGHSLLLLLMKVRLAAPTVLVDLRKIPGLHGIQRRTAMADRPDDPPRRPPGHARARRGVTRRRR